MEEFLSELRAVRRNLGRVGPLLIAALLALSLGCNHIHSGASGEYVYVTAKQTYLRDRVAVVANRVAQVSNGERLRVLEHGRRFLKVQTPQGEVGWLEEHAVIDQAECDKFQDLAKQHASDHPVANAVLFSELYLHLHPGRKSQHFYIFQPNTKVSLLQRVSVSRAPAANILGLPTAIAKPTAAVKGDRKRNLAARFTPPVPMEDWWLVRDAKGRVGWMLSRDLQVDVPEEVAQYAENEKMVGAYVLRTVDDPGSEMPNGKVPEYLTVLTPYRDGLPFDFDQVRVFTWDQRRHRYGTAFRLRNIAGFFPVKVVPGNSNGPNGPAPTFSILSAANSNAVNLDPATGVPIATQLQTTTYRMDGNLVHRTGPGGTQPGAGGKKPAVISAHRHRHKHRKKR